MATSTKCPGSGTATGFTVGAGLAGGQFNSSGQATRAKVVCPECGKIAIGRVFRTSGGQPVGNRVTVPSHIV